MPMLRNYGLKPFAPAPAGGWVGDVAVLNAETMPAADRYRTYLAVALGQVKVVIGTRAVMYAPVEARRCSPFWRMPPIRTWTV